jgi:A/G-specific adenine glycosylase
VRNHCGAYASGTIANYPERAATKDVPQRTCTALIVTDEQGRIFLQKRAEKGLLGGLYEVPTIPLWDKSPNAKPQRDKSEKNKKEDTDFAIVPRGTMLQFKSNCTYGDVKHVFSHLKLTLNVVGVDKAHAPVNLDSGVWVTPDAVKDYALSRLMQKVLAKIPTSGTPSS